MYYSNCIEAIFMSRPNRFIAYCEVGGEEVKVHVKNTGRCKELLIPGVTVYLEHSDNPSRKTAYSLIAVRKGERLINMDSQAPNKVVYEALKNGSLSLPGLEGVLTHIQPEKTYKDSRFDVYLETDKEKVFVEVKGVTLEEEGIVRFPDAPTERGKKHVYELMDALQQGYKTYVLFVIQMERVNYFTPNVVTHAAFAEALREAAGKGVQILAYDCVVAPGELTLGQPVVVKL
ncbi:MAG: DNA/RNA nuclease SfsA [Niameybacter sp.]|uniref:DNA/RNA nuclease SfsA n=1 Tax=Niameybacter sp. TaxID=2033640 RepID=UPI002FC71F11